MRLRYVGLALAVVALLGCACGGTVPPTTTAPSVSEKAGSVELRIVFTGLDAAANGHIVAAVYADAASFERGGEPFRSATPVVEGGGAEWIVELPPGVYAVKAFHDVDGDGELDRGAFGRPTEPYGVSNDARGAMGPPQWAEARVAVGPASIVLEIPLR